MSRSRLIQASAVVVLGGLALVQGSANAADAQFDCPVAVCVSVCPENEEDFCRAYDCNTSVTNCAPFGACLWVVYCGTDPN